GTITLAAYGYWLREKGWVAPGWMKVPGPGAGVGVRGGWIVVALMRARPPSRSARGWAPPGGAW
ncbi:hypothetical protein DZF92_11825, partial [Clavibacter michiganensis subsp. insidiosus]